jgi:ABC-type transporter MlaC component
MTNVAQRAPGDYIVNAVVSDPADTSDPPAPVSFRVLDEGAGKFALVDASVEGVWFTLAQRDDFKGFLDHNGGKISGLIAHLNDLAALPRPGNRTAR